MFTNECSNVTLFYLRFIVYVCDMAKKNEKDIRIVRPDKLIFDTVKETAKLNKRTIGKEAEFMLLSYLKKTRSYLFKIPTKS